MKANQKIMLSENAVSPVIGVMLMIVVTVILAAAVSSFANGMGKKDDPTQAIFEVECSASDGLIIIKHLGGDSIYKEDTKIEISHGLPKMTGYLSNENLTFYPAEQPDENGTVKRDAGMDKIALQPGQMATYSFSQQYVTYTDPFNGKNETMYHPVLDDQVVVIGETFHVSIIDVASENTIFSTDVVMKP
ncbi:type IV pilin N-terminal domain-containing protein [Methanolobus sp. ZRKC2]|uniref:type IV pilin n=1 Tax=Methanolobus sp. ZRKC2 TaxID=3125783 RepID=UPI003247A0B5